MNSLANLNSVVDEQGDSTTWPADQGWDPPVATICTGTLSDSRLHFHHSATPRQEWDWSDSQMILTSQYGAEDDELDCKPSILHVDAMGGSGLGLRQYHSTGFMSSMGTPSIGGSGGVGGSTSAQSSSWPTQLLNAVPLRPHIGLESSGGSCYSSSALMYNGVGLGPTSASNNNIGLGSYYNTHQGHMLDMEQRRIHDILKRGIYSGAGDVGSGRLGLNLGGRTYFSTEDMGARFQLAGAGKRFRPHSPSLHVPLCQAEGCKADLSIAKHYHRRHKVCEYHSKASTVIITGNTQRFCQQCSRFHALTEFDEGKRSCRKRLADHNRRRRKPQPAPALPAPNSATPSGQAPTSSTDNPASNQNEDQLQDSKPGASQGARSQSDLQGGQQSKDGMTGNKAASSSSTEQQTTSTLLSPMTLAPSVSLTLKNGGGRSEMQNNQSSNNMQLSGSSQDHNNEKEAAFIHERHSTAPYLLNGPSLSLSSNNVASANVSVGGDSVPSTNLHSPAHAPHNFNEVELSVPWLRGTHHVGSSPRMGLVHESLGKLSSSDHETDDRPSFMYNNSNSTARRNANGQYFNEHGRLLAEHMQSLHSQTQNTAPQDHLHAIKTENWMLESAVGNEGQTVLSLLETATSNTCRKKDSHDYNRQSIGAMHADHHNHQHHHRIEEAHENTAARHPLGFLQQHHHHHHHHHHPHHHGGLHLNSASPSDMDHEASDAALSLHCMQVLRPLNDSLYTTADFMKDGFV